MKCMNLLWAPWRIDYIRKKKSKKCFLCEFSKNKNSECLIWKRSLTLVVINRYPYNNGHLLVAPIKHKKELNQLSENEAIELFDTVKISINILRKTIKPQGFNIGINLGKCAGAGLPGHLHIHIVPRWNGDTNFMPVIASTKIISQSIEQLSKSLKKEFKKF
ncbi:MAG: HIT domain-containing protein [Candidatus Omnitrophica bacterium]|nr:HIT domain-containing protein [Candidatus Omnitrophota bacterium]